MAKKGSQQELAAQQLPGITKVTVSGYKSIVEEQSIEIRPLTLLAGANSSGKSSMVQPLLLLKQTLEASYDPGALLLDGPNVKFTSAAQLFSRTGANEVCDTFRIGVEMGSGIALGMEFSHKGRRNLDLSEMTIIQDGESIALRPGMTHRQIEKAIPDPLSGNGIGLLEKWEMAVRRNRCFLEVYLKPLDPRLKSLPITLSPGSDFGDEIQSMIHLPGLRGNPERTYPVTAVSGVFPGTFQEYTASVIAGWQQDAVSGDLTAAEKNGAVESIRELGRLLREIGLTSKVRAHPINDTQVELQVGRLPVGSRGGTYDMVSIADVGFGVSQTLPVLVALLVARPGQLVYLEQPEIHLHPRAQVGLANVLADAARRGVRVIVETHSSLLLLAIQTLVAEGSLASDLVRLHWFQRDQRGHTQISSADVDASGAFGDWPEDFGQVILAAEDRFLTAVEKRMEQGR